MASCTTTPPNPPKPSKPDGFSGSAWPEMCMSSKASSHFYGIGDWGGDHTTGNTWHNPSKPDGRNFMEVDNHGQFYVARQMKDLASRPETEPDFVLNAGDNFYPGGYDDHCGPNQASGDDPLGIFQKMLDNMYGGPGMDGKPWLGVLGNHDFGGISMGMGWDQTIFHSWHSDNWRTPAPHWSQRVQYQDFAVQFIFLDSNKYDAYDTTVEDSHNICQTYHGSAPFCSCWDINTPGDCANWFQDQWHGGLQMAEDILKNSTAEWHILVSHFPQVFQDDEVQRLKTQYGIDAIFVGHTHSQSLVPQDDGTVHIISGGGGGVTTDSALIMLETGLDDSFGFTDFEINRTHLTINMRTWGGCTSCDGSETTPGEQNIWQSATITPHGSRSSTAPQGGSVVLV